MFDAIASVLAFFYSLPVVGGSVGYAIMLLTAAVMMLLMPLLAVALAIPPKRSTSSLGIFVSIVLVVSYHKVNQYGEDIATIGRIDPTLALWGPFFIFGALILWMYYRVAFVPGGQAIGALEAWFDKLTKRFKELFGPKRRESSVDSNAQLAPAE